MFDRILMPLDGSPESQAIRDWVVGIAAELDAPVDLLAVIDPTRLKQSPGEDETEVQQKEAEYARAYLRTQSDWFQEHGVTVASHVAIGDPAETIIDQAHELGTKLIAMTTRRRSSLMRGILGSVADRVLHSTGVPIMLARPGGVSGFDEGGGLPKTVVVPLDGSNFSEAAIPFAEAIAKHAHGRVHYVSGLAPNSSYMAYSMADPAVGIDLPDGTREKMPDYLDRIKERSGARGVTATCAHVLKNAADAIIQEASARDSMVIMTSHGASGVKRWLLGSVADKVIRMSEHPVIVIPPEHQQVSYMGGTSRSRNP